MIRVSSFVAPCAAIVLLGALSASPVHAQSSVEAQCGSHYARFVNFVRGPGATLRYALAMLARREPAMLGHNPLGAWMILAFILLVALVGVSGWLYTIDRYWGLEWVEALHSKLADALLVLVGLHVAGVLYASWRHRENLIGAMIHGRKRRRSDDAPTATAAAAGSHPGTTADAYLERSRPGRNAR